MAIGPKFGLTTKVLFPLLFLVLVFSLTLSWLNNHRDAEYQQMLLRAELENFTNLQAKSLAPLLWSFDTETIAAVFDGYAHFPDVQSIALYDDHDHLLNHLGDVDAAGFDPNLRLGRDIFSEKQNGSERIGRIAVTFQDNRLRQYVEKRQHEALWMTLGLMVMIAGGTIWVIRLGIALPLRRLQESLQRAGSEAQPEPVIWTSRDELGEVVTAYNQLLHLQSQAQQKVAAYRDHLEDLVSQRTTELERDRNNLRIVLAELSKRSTYLNAVIEGSGTGVFCIAADGKILEANDELARFLKVEADQVSHHNFFDLLLGDGPERVRQQIQSILSRQAERFRTECEFRRPSGSQRWATLTLAALSLDDNDHRLIGVIDDVTELKRSHEQFRALLDSAPDPMIITSEDNIITMVNLQAESLFGCNRQDLIGMNIQTLLLVPPMDAGTASDVFALRHNGDRIPVDIATSPIKTGNKVLIARTLRDITLHRESQKQMAQARQLAEEASSAKSNFLANMSHEIRTPMNAIIGLTYLAMSGEVPPRARDYLSKIQAAAQSLLGIINDILDFSKIEAGKMAIEEVEFNIEDIFKTLTAALSVRVAENGPEFLFTLDPNLPRAVVGDPQRLIQVLLNLGSNAVKFTASGDIQIACSLTAQGDDWADLEFSVTDTGIGMSPDQMDKLFQAFTQADGSITRRFGGTGLGLVISQQLVRLMGGTICVTSELGQGSCFTFTLRLRCGPQAPRLLPFPDTVFFAGLSVLVIDDNQKSRTILQRYLTAFGCTCTCLPSGQAALDHLTATGQPFGMILLDWRMPDMNGQETAVRLRCVDALQQVPIIAMVGTSDRDYMSNLSPSLGIAAWTIKPISPSSLMDAIMAALGHGGTLTAPQLEASALPCFTGRILLVEDNDLNQQVATELLHAVGLTVVIANNGREGVDSLNAQDFDLVLMDVQMPVMDGYAATRLIRQSPRFAHLPILAMTANAMGGDRELALAAGMNDHIPKPIDVTILYEKIGHWLHQSPPLPPVVALPEPHQDSAMTDQIVDTPLVDPAMGLKNAAGSAGLYQRLIKKFVDREHDVVDRLCQAIADQDRELAVRIVHTLKSSSLTLGAKDLGDLSAQLELYWKQDGDLRSDLPLLNDLVKMVPPVLNYFNDHLGQ